MPARTRAPSASIPAAKSRSWFARFARQTSRWTGRPSAFFVALAVVIAWVVTGPFYRFSDTWMKRKGQWVCVASANVKVTPPAKP